MCRIGYILTVKSRLPYIYKHKTDFKFLKKVYMIIKIHNVSIRCIIFKNSARCLISENDLSEKKQHGIDKSRIKTLCFLTICFDVSCSCEYAKKDTSTGRNNTLTTSDSSLSCVIFNRRINEANNELENRNTPQTEGVKDDNVSFANEAFTQKRGMPRFMKG